MAVAAVADRRIAPRYRPAFETVCRLGEGRPVVGLVWNISETGVSLLLPDPLDAGLHFPAILAFDGFSDGVRLGVTIVHSRLVSTGDYLLGAKFDRPLTTDELLQFLTPPVVEPAW